MLWFGLEATQEGCFRPVLASRILGLSLAACPPPGPLQDLGLASR